ncbi:MAG: class I SAM-dependent methyltransferase [Desulfobacteraceae bacterium]|nr:class I SAM-dependent methyltransferase [Pseudomonadota bacterium]MCG2750702.1 class I SAM-dependent methyltransferase [Desulfobacteraceae bacterium]
MNTNDMYDKLASVYHLIFSDWEKAIEKGAEDLDQVIKRYTTNSSISILDVSCGIGTQVIGLGKKGYKVTGSDLSAVAIQRAHNETQKRGLDIDLSVADMRQVHKHHNRQFDVVISCHNSVTHLQNDSEIINAFKEFYQCTKSDGICLINVRDYDNEEKGKGIFKPLGVRVENDAKWIVFQIWDFESSFCDVAMYFVKDDEKDACRTSVFRTHYYAIGISKLMELMKDAGFSSVQRIDDCFDGPIIKGKKRKV